MASVCNSIKIRVFETSQCWSVVVTANEILSDQKIACFKVSLFWYLRSRWSVTTIDQRWLVPNTLIRRIKNKKTT